MDNDGPAAHLEALIAEHHVALIAMDRHAAAVTRSQISGFAERAASILARPGDPSDPLEAAFALPAAERL